MKVEDLYKYYEAKDLADVLNHIRSQLDYLCYTAARINEAIRISGKSFEEPDDSNDKGDKADNDND